MRSTLMVWFAAALLLVGAGALMGGFIAQRPDSDAAAMHLRSDRVAQTLVRNEFEAQLQLARSRIDQALSEGVVERAARIELEKNLAQAQVEMGRLKDQLAFYEQLLPPGPQGAIDLRAVDLVRQGQALSYRVLLMRSGRLGERFSGRLEFVATGQSQGKEATYILSPLQAGLPSPAIDQVPIEHPQTDQVSIEQLKLEFEQFQRSQGVLALPPDFEPHTVTVRVLDGDIVLASRRVDL